MTRDYRSRLQDIAEAAAEALSIAEGLTREDFSSLASRTPVTFRAIKNAIAEVGEAIKALPNEVRERYPEIGWRDLAGQRDVIVHGYFKVDPVRLWPVLTKEFPALLAVVQKELDRDTDGAAL